MNIVFTERSEADFEDIGDWIARDNPERALSFINELAERCRALADFPNRFPVVRNIDEFELRKMTHGSYLVFYAVFDDRVEIVRIIHASRDWERLFEGL